MFEADIPPQTASHIHIWHKQSVRPYWYAVHRHMHTVAASHSILAKLAQIWEFWVTWGV